MDTSQYFYRNVIFSKQGNTVSLVDIENPEGERKELEPWFGMVLLLADGQHSIEQLLQYLSTQYQGNPPPSLEKTVHSVVERLSESNFIVLTENPVELPYYLSLPLENLDIEKAKELLKQDKTKAN